MSFEEQQLMGKSTSSEWFWRKYLWKNWAYILSFEYWFLINNFKSKNLNTWETFSAIWEKFEHFCKKTYQQFKEGLTSSAFFNCPTCSRVLRSCKTEMILFVLKEILGRSIRKSLRFEKQKSQEKIMIFEKVSNIFVRDTLTA